MTRMAGAVRGVSTLIGAGAAGLLVWVSAQIGRGTLGGYWAAYGILAGAGLTMALSQLVVARTAWGRPRISVGVFLLGFLPVLICAGWVLLSGQPDTNWFQRHTNSWSNDIAIDGPVHDLRSFLGVLAFGLGLVLGFTFTTARRLPPPEQRRDEPVPVEEPAATYATPPDEQPTTVERTPPEHDEGRIG